MYTRLRNINLSITFLRTIIQSRLQIFFQKGDPATFIYPKPVIEQNNDPICQLLTGHQLCIEEYIIMVLALYPHIQPNLLDQLIQEYLPQGGDFAEIGGVKGTNHRSMLPTGETAQFIIAGNDLEKRIYLQTLLQEKSVLVKEQIVWLEPVKEGEPVMSGRLLLSSDWLSRLLTGVEKPPKFGTDFPAKKVETDMNWEDLVLDDYTARQITEIQAWLQHHAALQQDEVLKRKIRPGYRVMFHGPPGTGKTLTATLLGKQFEKDVYKIDLSQVVSKYIGETEKNLENIFTRAERKNWILFFDEADALFGKRTQVQSSHDRYANQEVSYLLQRVEDYPGLLILASNFKNNIDDAFLRRFHTIIHFPPPGAAERLDLWKKTMPASIQAEPGLDLQKISEIYELTGASILNIVHYASLQALAKGDGYIRRENIIEGIKKEYRKEDKTLSG